MSLKSLDPIAKGWYITGFADGESYFMARPVFRETKAGFVTVSFSLRWGIQLRGDDIEILNDIFDYFRERGVRGNIFVKKRKTDISSQASLYFDGVSNLKPIREHFAEFPIVGKKKVDFEKWSLVYDTLEEFMSDMDYSQKYGKGYPEQQLYKRLYVCKLCDELRVARLNPEMKDLGTRELLRQAGGQDKLYVEVFLDKLLAKGNVSEKQYEELKSKFCLKI